MGKLSRKSLIINGVQRYVVYDPDKDSLADVLRKYGLTGTKIGCGKGVCGACTVILDKKVTRSCVIKMKKVADFAEVITIEGNTSDMVARRSYGIGSSVIAGYGRPRWECATGEYTPSPAPAPSQARIAVDKPPAPRRRIKPEYPRGARERGEEGDVTLELDITATGTVDDVRIIASCGFPELEQAAIQAVRRARFTPARRGSAKVPATARITLTFRLRD